MTGDERFMMRAIELAREGMRRGDGGPFGAVVVRGGEIVGEGWNRVLATHDPTAHGEVVAIRDASARLGRYSLEGCEIHTTGEPCPMCLGAIMWARIGRVFHGFGIEDAARAGFDDSGFFRELALPKDRRALRISALCAEESRALLEEYLSLPGRITY